MKNLVVGFSRPRGFFKPLAWLIRLIEWTPYSHVYIRSMSNQLGVDLIYQASGAQVNFMGLEHFKNHAVSVREFEFEISDDKYSDFMKWAITNSGADYSVCQLFGIVAVKLFGLKKNPIKNGQKAWICSELAGYVLTQFSEIKISADELECAGPRKIYELCRKSLKESEI